MTKKKTAKPKKKPDKASAEVLRLVRSMESQRKELEKLRARVESGVDVRVSTLEKAAKKSTGIMQRLRGFATKHRAKFVMYLAYAVIASRPEATGAQITIGFLFANAWLIAYVQKLAVKTVMFFVTHHVFAPMIIAYKSLEFVIYALTGLHHLWKS